ncbi:alcohol dehydrogenase, iron-containing superfamily [marine gamma proteobacterium HTCC2148]|nr:alcohol dehydrogenase, iron-containing superfamily [marine gamma proteobacterium HTCC2148]
MSQQAFIGPGSLEHVKEILGSHQAKKILLVTGKKSYIESGAKDALDPYLEGSEVIRFSDFTPNPKLEDAQAGISLIDEVQPDIVIAIGGGSVIDMGKLIVILSAQVEKNTEEIVLNQDLVRTKGLPFVAVPTTAGTGSEATHFAVVYIENVKYSLAHDFILPDYAIVDALLTHKVPSPIIASCSMDALTQAIESYWSVGSTEESKAYASRAIRMVLPVLKSLHGGDRRAKEIMAEAAYLAGKAINITKTTAAHAISYPITTYFDVPHGHAVALLLGKFFVIHAETGEEDITDKRGKAHLSEVMSDLFSMFGCDNAQDCCKQWYKTMDEIGLQTDLQIIGIKTDTDVQLIESKISLERLNNNPVKVSPKMLHDLLLVSWNSCS